MMKFFYSTLCILFSSIVFSQSHIYQFKIHDMGDDAIRKDAQQILAKIFDVAPDYYSALDLFTVKSETDISSEDFYEKLYSYGYLVETFIKDEDSISLPNNADAKE